MFAQKSLPHNRGRKMDIYQITDRRTNHTRALKTTRHVWTMVNGRHAPLNALELEAASRHLQAYQRSEGLTEAGYLRGFGRHQGLTDVHPGVNLSTVLQVSQGQAGRVVSRHRPEGDTPGVWRGEMERRPWKGPLLLLLLSFTHSLWYQRRRHIGTF
ncbi:hypothetical protein ElyMa_002455900 [Elysia marginata]|uniref:Uncharacterized protein n=1 Tax=Elysia marginata TaxID=1093978 RepID=A0AAV4GLX1_9GAST|nr:hypothetical protein ElyMa_002455900 [Elysia marginata]